jgi:hypothetical protein
VGGPNSPTNDYGTCTCPSTTTVRITSSDPTRSWAANVWDQTLTGKHAQILLSYSVGSGVTAKIRRKVIANTALTPGGTCDITVDQPLPIVAYDTYALRGTAGGAADVYRKYQAADPYYRTHMSNQPFSFPMAWHNTNSASVSQANTSTCSILYSATGQAPYAESPMGIDVDPDSGFIWTNKPVVVLNGTQSLLEEGGNNVDGIPNDIVMIIGVNMGILVSTCPADAGSPYLSPQFGGTSHTIEGLSTTKTVQVTDWRDPSNQANMDLLACALLDAFKDTRFEGSIPYDGLFVPSIFPGAKYNATSDEGATGFEAMNSPGMAFGVEWDEALIHRSQITVSNRKDPYSGQEFLAPAQTGAPIGLHDESIFSAFDKSKGMSFLSGFDQPTSPSSMGGTAPPPGPDEFMNEDMGGFV